MNDIWYVLISQLFRVFARILPLRLNHGAGNVVDINIIFEFEFPKYICLQALAVFSALIAVASTATIQVDNGPQQKVQVDTSDSSTASAGPQQPGNVNTNIFNIEGGGCCGNGGKPAQRGQKGNASDTRPGQGDEKTETKTQPQ